ncbi:cysteine-rich neurotrophic factor-like [Physella acuta]|uniref:cysteine-rich neurotrophic factor-like n=1 Tax=Physella acuta TaxID=109671 RepID=UPI0027DDB694|nr:cysteine-rich neurotrophic factor-like [Physella acuta]
MVPKFFLLPALLLGLLLAAGSCDDRASFCADRCHSSVVEEMECLEGCHSEEFDEETLTCVEGCWNLAARCRHTCFTSYDACALRCPTGAESCFEFCFQSLFSPAILNSGE